MVYKDAKAHKFCKLNAYDSKVLIYSGKFGTQGQFKVKEMNTRGKAENEIKKLVHKNISKGFEIVENGLPFYKLQELLLSKGWYVGWCEGGSQRTAWHAVPYEHKVGPFKDKPINYNKTLVNHEQNVPTESEEMLTDILLKNGFSEVQIEDFFLKLDDLKRGHWEQHFIKHNLSAEFFKLGFGIKNWSVNPWLAPHETNGSLFSFGNAKKLTEVLPLIEESGCTYTWSGSINDCIKINW